MKRFLCFAAAACLIACSSAVLPACGSASVKYTLSEDGTYYIVSGVSGSKSALTSVEIPATYGADNLPVKEIGDGAFADCHVLSRVTIPDSVEVIGATAFKYCGFSQIIIPDSVTTIKYGAFGMCESLISVTVPESVTVMEELAFAYCSRLQKVYFKADMDEIPAGAFMNTLSSNADSLYTDSSMTDIYISSGVRKIGYRAFYGNVFITGIHFGGTEEEWEQIVYYNSDGTEDTGFSWDNVTAMVYEVEFDSHF